MCWKHAHQHIKMNVPMCNELMTTTVVRKKADTLPVIIIKKIILNKTMYDMFEIYAQRIN